MNSVFKKGEYLAGEPILITGSHRSGTTWVGRMLAASTEVAYIHEPFSPIHNNSIDYWFTYVTEENEACYYEPIKKKIELHYDLFDVQNVSSVSSQRAKRKIIRNLKIMEYRLSGRRVLVKDPIAVFSAEWLAKRFDMKTVVLIRHPAAFAGSLKKKAWIHPFAQFLHQPLLIRDHLEPFTDQIVDYAEHPADIIDQACLLWRIIYSVVHKYQDQHKDWIFIRHEDISKDPLKSFRTLFGDLGLEFTPKIQAVVEEHSQAINPDEPSPAGGNLKRNSKTNIHTWKKRLSDAEICYIRKQVEDVSHCFYTDMDWL